MISVTSNVRNSWPRQSSVCLAAVLLGTGAMACGSSNHAGQSHSGATVASQPERDYADGDGDTKHRDDSKILQYGHRASAADSGAIAALFKRYYAAAAADDGALACSLMHPPLVARILAGEEQPTERPPLKGASCAKTTKRIFKYSRYKLAIEVAKLKPIEVRTAGNTGYALLRYEIFPSAETVYMPVQREADTWKIDALFGKSLL